MRVLVDGVWSSRIEAADRGFQYGDGVFETLRVRHGEPVLWQRHWQRLCRGLDRLAIRGVREGDCLDDLAAVASVPSAIVKLIVTRGAGPRGYAVSPGLRATRVVMGGDPELPVVESGPLRLGVCRTRVLPSVLPECKHLNRLENVLARMEWGSNWDEGLMLDRSGRVVCGTQSNVFVVESGQLITPPVRRSGVAGTRRGWILDRAAQAGIAVREEPLPLPRVRAAAGVFLSNARIGLRLAVWADGIKADGVTGSSRDLIDRLCDLGAELDALA